MKNRLFIIIVLVTALTFSSCGKAASALPSTIKNRLNEILTTRKNENVAANNNSTSRCFYGEDTGTDKTYTGLEPLPLMDFNLDDMYNKKGKATKTVSHSFGIASNEKPHAISIGRQKFFDENGYDAVCINRKTDEKLLYLTFDCGYENGYTLKILDALKERGVTAAFFCTLPQMKENPEIVARMIKDGHIVGNHSVTHPNFSTLSRSEMIDEVKGFDDYIRLHFGYSSLYFRYPEGKYNENSLDALNTLGYKCVFWSLAYEDWNMNKQKGAAYAHDTVIARLHPGAVILLHAISPDNAAALGKIIDSSKAMGYKFMSLNDIN